VLIIRAVVRHIGVFLAAVALASAVSDVARADEPAAPAADPYAAFRYATPQDKQYLRAGLEVGSVLGVGLVDYLLNTTARGGTLRAGEIRWDLRYDWPTLHDKLTGVGLNLDSNKFPTNYASHPLAGTLYFQAARSNHLSFAESFLYAILGSTTWEYFGEIREITSINDLIVTPVSGAAIGESTMQLAGFFDRGRKQFSNDALSFLFSPVKSVNDAFDSSHPLRSTETDSLGFTREIWHRFVASAGAGVTIQHDAGPGHPRGVYADQRVGVDFALANLPGYGGAGKQSHLYDDGNVSNFAIDATFSQGRAVDSLFATRIVPIGYYVRDAEVDEAGKPRGSGGLLGFRMGFEYGMHEWDRDGGRPVDITCFVSPLGVASEYVYASGPFQLRTALDLYGALTGVTPYAFGDYMVLHQNVVRGLPTVLANQGYYHSVSITAVPQVEARWRAVGLGVRWRFDTFRPITGHDENEPLVDESIRMSDRRSILQATLALTPPSTPIRIAVDARRASRAGRMGTVESSRDESSLLGSIGVVF
jgi:hypothetical protein